MIRGLIFCLLTASTALAQAAIPGTIQAVGSATITFTPNQAQFTVGVVTQGTTAQDAAQQNATLSTTVQNALKSALGTNGNLQTLNYSVTPRYSNQQPPILIGYTASNTVEVTSYNLSAIGNLIDVATQAGANNVGGVSFGLQNPDPLVQQALTQAGKQALAYAAAIAAGVGGKAGAVVSAIQGTAYAPITVPGTAAGSTTPIQVGTVSISASVTVTVQLQ
ncbi:MAG TPA: SIMPL domain-containing protein [Bryobacteraceae bacterium]